MKKNTGFTLVELLIVIAIIGILAALAAPNLSGFVRKNRIQNQTRRLYSDLMNTRIMAMNTNRIHFMVIAGNGYDVIEDTNGDASKSATPPDTLRLVRTGMVPFTWSNTVPQNESMSGLGMAVFDGRGIATQTGAICIPTPAGYSFKPSTNCVVVAPTRIRMGQYTTGDVCDADHCK